MDKNKNRTDLLAAGRKKLQQFRQKKDGKGSKSLGKASKADREVAADFVAKPAEVKLQFPSGEGAVQESELVDSSVLSSRDNSVATDADVETLDLSLNSCLPEKGTFEVPSAAGGFPAEDLRVGEAGSRLRLDSDYDVNALVPGEYGSTSTLDNGMTSVSSSETVIFEGKPNTVTMPLAANEYVEANEAGESKSARGEHQVSDVGAMQEAYSSGLEQVDRSNLMVLEGDRKPALSGLNERAQVNSGMVEEDKEMEGTSRETEQTSAPDSFSAFAGATSDPEVLKTDERSVSPPSLIVPDGFSALTPAPTIPPREDIVAGPYGEVVINLPHITGDSEGNCAKELEVENEEPSLSKDPSFVRYMESQMISVGEVSSYSLSELANVLQVLGEDEFRFLVMERESTTSGHLNNSGRFTLPKYRCSDFFERLKEQLYLTNFEKEMFHLQLIEQLELQMEFDRHFLQSIEGKSMVGASPNEVQGKNGYLADELAAHRSEPDVVACGKEVLQKQFDSKKIELDEFSARIDELQLEVDRLQHQLSNVATELVDCRGLVATLQIENEDLNGCVASVTNENKKLEKERGDISVENEKLMMELMECKTLLELSQVENINSRGSLAVITEGMTKIEEEKESYVLENDKLVAELASWKGLVEALQVENGNINGILSSVRDDRSKLEEEKDYFVQENEKLSAELKGYKALEESLRMEISVLNGSLARLTQERNRLGEEKDDLKTEKEEKVTELMDCRSLIIGLQVEYGKAVDDQKEAALHLLQLTEENTTLISSLDIYKAKIRELDNWKTELSHQYEEAGNKTECFNMHSTDQESITDRDGSQQVHEKETATSFPTWEENISYGLSKISPNHLKWDIYDNSSGFIALKRHLDEVEKVMQNLEKAIEGMYSHSASMSKSGGKAVLQPGISKLIQAFESKAHIDDTELEEAPLCENQLDSGPYMLTKEQTSNLRKLFKELVLDAENASELFKGVRSGKVLSDTKLRELMVHHESLKQQSNSLEANIELVVLYEVVKQYVCTIEAKKGELLGLYEGLRQQIFIKAENSELRRKLSNCESRINALQVQLNEFYQRSDNMASSINHQLEIFHKEVAEREILLEEGWNSTISWVVKAIEKLEASVGTTCSTLSSDTSDNQDVGTRVASSVDVAASVIKDLQGQLENAHRDHKSLYSSYKDMTEKVKDLQGKSELAADVLNKVYGNLEKLIIDFRTRIEESQTDFQNEKLLDPTNISNYDILIEQLRKLLGERLQLESTNRKHISELLDRTKDIEELNRRCLGPDLILKLLDDIESVVKLEGVEIQPAEAVSSIESMIHFLIEKYKKADGQLSVSREKLGSKEKKLTELEGQIDHLSFLIIPYENESLIFKESLRRAMDYLVMLQSEIQLKVTELEQSELRVSSLREKLHIAVAKGKGLVLQRDSLKQSLTATSIELEKCLHELQLKDARLYEIETTLKIYSEAGERVEALESELSYIRNSATALRESFLLKDSVLQRIEEILEDLELPEHFHARDIIEKVDWLARLVSGNSLPVTDWDQKSSTGGRSHSDSGFGVMDAWKEDLQPASVPGDELRRKYEELESKFFGLAEQNEMLEQSLMERNNLVQRWEEILDKINMPSQLRSMEPEDRIEWLGGALSEAHDHCDSLQQKIDKFESFCGSLTANLEDSQSRIADLEAALQSITSERYHLSATLEKLSEDYNEVSGKATLSEIKNDKLQNDIGALQLELDKMHGVEEHMHHLDSELRRLLDLVREVLQDPCTEDVDLSSSSTECLERLLRKLVDKYTNLSLCQLVSGDAVDEHINEETSQTHGEKRIRQSDDHEEQHVGVLKKELEEALGDLMRVKEERDIVVDKNQSLVLEVEALEIKRQELNELLIQEGQRSASVKEKLNVAVRKGKSLVQQRDSMRQHINDVTTQMARLNSEIQLRENTLSEYELKIKDLSTFRERMEDMESEIVFLRNRLTETESELEDKNHSLSMISGVLADIDLGAGSRISDPFKRLEEIGKKWCDLHVAMASSEQNSVKSKRAAELLLAELNEVQERNDGLQEELSKAAMDLSQLSKERDSAEASKHETLSRLEQLSALRSEERRNQFSELTGLKSGIDQLMAGFLEVKDLVSDVLPKDLDSLYNLEASMKSLLESSDIFTVVGQAHKGASTDIFSAGSENKVKILDSDSFLYSTMEEQFSDKTIIEIWRFLGHRLQDLTTMICSVKEKLQSHSKSLHEEANVLSETVGSLRSERTSYHHSFESVKEHIARLESIEKQQDTENLMLRKYISALFEACKTSVMEIEKCKAQLVGNDNVVGDLIYNLEFLTSIDGDLFSGQTLSTTEECITNMVNRVLSVVKDFHSIQAETVEASGKDMKAAISKLQKELQEKDIQKDRICVELVSQIKEAEATAKNYLQELQPAKAQIHDLQRQLDVMNEQQSILEHRVKELQDQEAISVDLQERVRSLTEALTAKEQETEALMQALDEEESQMEYLTNKIAELERFMLQKDIDLENAEASRGKAMKKLSITMSKFDELHHLSSTLLSEVEKLQSQIQERDEEISFLRHEITRCTTDALLASKSSNERSLDDIRDILAWLDSMISGVQKHVVHRNDDKGNQVPGYKEILQKKIAAIISEMEDLQEVARSKDNLLHIERSRVEELMQKGEFLENSLREKESQLTLHQGVDDSGHVTSMTSEIMEVEPVINKWAVQGTSVTPQVRGLRKLNNDQIAIAIDMEPNNGDKLEDEDDDKAHGFKTLTTSKIVPRFTRPLTDMIDGLWVSCDRALMRQPALRLGVIIYWTVLHALLAIFVV